MTETLNLTAGVAPFLESYASDRDVADMTLAAKIQTELIHQQDATFVAHSITTLEAAANVIFKSWIAAGGPEEARDGVAFALDVLADIAVPSVRFLAEKAEKLDEILEDQAA